MAHLNFKRLTVYHFTVYHFNSSNKMFDDLGWNSSNYDIVGDDLDNDGTRPNTTPFPTFAPLSMVALASIQTLRVTNYNGQGVMECVVDGMQTAVVHADSAIKTKQASSCCFDAAP